MKTFFAPAVFALALGFSTALPALLADDSTPPPPPPPDASTNGAPTPADQPPPPPPGRARRGDPLKMLTEKLGLTADQQQKVGAILKDQRAQMKALRDDTTLSDDDRRAKMHDLMKSAHDQIRALLTPDQQKTFDAMPPMGPRRRADQ